MPLIEHLQLHNNVLFGVGVLLLASFAMGRLAQRVSLPSVTGYIIAGLLLGPHALGFVGNAEKITHQLEPIPHIALGLIALTIGARFSIAEVRRLGLPVAILTLFQLVATFVVVAVALRFCGVPSGVAMMLGAIASATAPAATMAVVNEYRARGPLTDTLVATIALDDFGAIVLFSIASAFARPALGAAEGAGAILSSLVMQPALEIGGSILTGAIAGVCAHLLVRKRRNDNEVRIITLGVLFFTSALTMEMHLSPLITNMTTGFVLINLSSRNVRVLRLLQPLEAPIYATFFALAGAELDPSTLPGIGLVGTVYIVGRLFGKYVGSYAGAAAARMSKMTRNLIGVCMFPQAGVAIGLVMAGTHMMAKWELDAAHTSATDLMVSVVIASVLVNELLGPPLVKYAIFKSGEVTRAGRESEKG